jgi:hypothetical protein
MAGTPCSPDLDGRIVLMEEAKVQHAVEELAFASLSGSAPSLSSAALWSGNQSTPIERARHSATTTSSSR